MIEIMRDFYNWDIEHGKYPAKTIIKITYYKIVERKTPVWENVYKVIKVTKHIVDSFKLYQIQIGRSNFCMAAYCRKFVNWNLIDAREQGELAMPNSDYVSFQMVN